MTRLAPALIALIAALAGCGLGPGSEQSGDGVALRVTRDFGAKTIASGAQSELRSSDTVMRLLQSSAKVTTRYGGGFVQSIDGIAGTERGGRFDWFYFVNGIEAPVGAANRKLHPGDVVQWDYRRWDATPRVPAIVGAFPEPFAHGHEGKRYPTRVECGKTQEACAVVRERLDEAGARAGSGSLGAEARGGVLRMQVGAWSELSRLQVLDPLEEGPSASGVYARFEDDGSLSLLDERGRVARKAPAGTGLIAALVPEEQQPLWVVTGVDDAGVMRAAEHLRETDLRNAYAVAVTPAGPVRLPVGAR